MKSYAWLKAIFECEESQDKYLRIFENSNDAIFIHENQGQIMEVNPKACHLTNYSKDELLGMKIFQLLLENGALKIKKGDKRSGSDRGSGYRK